MERIWGEVRPGEEVGAEVEKLCYFVEMVKEEIVNKRLHLNRDVKDTKGESGRCLEESPGVGTVSLISLG